MSCARISRAPIAHAFLVRSINEEGLETERIAALLLLRRGISVARGDQSEEEVSKNLEVTKKLPKLTVRLAPPRWLSSRGRIFSPVPFASTSRQCVEDRNRREKTALTTAAGSPPRCSLSPHLSLSSHKPFRSSFCSALRVAKLRKTKRQNVCIGVVLLSCPARGMLLCCVESSFEYAIYLFSTRRLVVPPPKAPSSSSLGVQCRGQIRERWMCFVVDFQHHKRPCVVFADQHAFYLSVRMGWCCFGW